MLQERWLSMWTFYRYSQSISQRSSLSWITTRNRMDRTKVQRVRWTCKKRPYISSHSRGTEKTPRTMACHLEQDRQKWAYETSIRFSSSCLYQKSSTPLVRLKSWRAYFSTTIQEMASPLQAHRGGTSLNGIGNDLIIFFFKVIFFFCYSWFRLQSMAIHCNRRGV